MDERYPETWNLIRQLIDADNGVASAMAYRHHTIESLKKQFSRDVAFGGLNPYTLEPVVRKSLQKHGIYDFGA